MSGPFGAGALQYFSGAAEFYPYTIDQSVRFNDDDTAMLSKTFASASNRRTWTWSGWVKRGNIGNTHPLFVAGSSGSSVLQFSIQTSGVADRLALYNYTGSYNLNFATTQLFRDVAGWYHIVLKMDTTQATSTDRVKIYVNGDEVTSFSTSSYPSQNFETLVNTAASHRIGRNFDTAVSTKSLDGYLAEVNFIDGTALDASSFGETKNGIWIPKQYTGSYGTNGFKLAFQDSAALGDDTSGNGNDFTATNLAATDQMLDTPTSNFATFNPLDNNNTSLFSEGNLEVGSATGSHLQGTRSTFAVTQNFYYEACKLQSGTTNFHLGVATTTADISSTSNSGIYTKAQSSGSAGDIIMIAYSADANAMWSGKNGTWDNGASVAEIEAGTTTNATHTGIEAESIAALFLDQASSFSGSVVANFGQDGTFAGNKTAQGNSDDNGVGDFYYAPPSGYLALCTDNLPDPGIDPNAGQTPGDYFTTVLSTGDGTNATISGFGFQPDFLWHKSRSSANGHWIMDSIRVDGSGDSFPLRGDDLNAEGSTAVVTLNSDGYVHLNGSSNNYYGSGKTYVDWAWKAGGTAVSNTDGDITSSVSASPESGFSVVTYTGNGTAGETIGHGLGKAPSMIIVKNRTTGYSYGWNVYHAEVGATKGLSLDTDATPSTLTSLWNDTAPTSSVFTVGGIVSNNRSGNEFVAYCFADIDGMVKAGSYTGNGSSDGPFVYTGFRPAWVMIKRTDVANNWVIFDAVRNTFNIADARLDADLPDIESTGGSIGLHLVSNGFQINATANLYDATGGTYIYLAFAEQPFKYANAR